MEATPPNRTEESKTLTERLLERNTGREMGELLRDLYVAKRYSDLEIGKALGVSRNLVTALRQKYGINREDRAPIVIEQATA